MPSHASPIVLINPGCEPVLGGTLEQATANMQTFAHEVATGFSYDTADASLTLLTEDTDQFGNHQFTLAFGDGPAVSVDMPGLPLAEVRCGDGDNPWNFPRLWVDGSSWLWAYAVSACGDAAHA